MSIDIDEQDIIIRIKPVPFAAFRKELLDEEEGPYAPGMVAKQTRRAMVRALDFLGELRAPTDEGESVPVVKATTDLNARTIVRVVKALPDHLSPHSKRGLLRCISAACTIAEQSGYLRINPFKVKRIASWIPWAPPAGKRHLTREELATLLGHLRAQTEDGRTGWRLWKSRRIYAMAAVAAYTGLRASELFSLHVADVDIPGRMIHVSPREKRKTLRSVGMVPMAEALVPIVEDWLAHRTDPPIFPAEVPFLWPGSSGKCAWTSGAPGDKPTQVLAVEGLRAGIKEVHFQALRRSLATHLVGGGAGTATAAQILRHSEAVDAEWYQQCDPSNLRAAVRDLRF